MAKKMGNPPVSKGETGWLKADGKDPAVRFNPVMGTGSGLPTFSEATRFGKVDTKDSALRFNPKKPS